MRFVQEFFRKYSRNVTGLHSGIFPGSIAGNPPGILGELLRARIFREFAPGIGDGIPKKMS